VLDQDQYKMQRSEDDDGNHNVVQPNIKFASLKEQSFVYGSIPDDESINYHDGEVGKCSTDRTNVVVVVMST
jgi:hypothetical protein